MSTNNPAPRQPNEVVFVTPDGYELTRGEITTELGEIINHVVEHLTEAVQKWSEDPDPEDVGPIVQTAVAHLMIQVMPGLSGLAQHDSEQAKIAEGIRRYAESLNVDSTVPDFVPPDWA